MSRRISASQKVPLREVTGAKRVEGRPVIPAFLGDLWAFLLGVLISLSLVKIGNPVILGHMVPKPRGLEEWLQLPWPPGTGFWVVWLLLLAGAGLAFQMRRDYWRDWFKGHRVLVLLPFLWLVWQGMAVLQSSDPAVSRVVGWHYASLAGCFYCGMILGHLGDKKAWWFWLPLVAGFFWVMLEGFNQHYGGLEATRKFVYGQPGWQEYPPEFLKRLARDRVFSTLFYANALAGVILLLLPGAGWFCWNGWSERMRVGRAVAVGLAAYAGLACLYWTGSKAGWLIAIFVAAVAFLHFPIGRRLRVALVLVGIVLALAAFAFRFQDYFRQGATSVVARFDYWNVAARTVVAHPILGTGPGTFEQVYREMKPPDAEMSRLVHNDYLQQASDSGIPGAVLFLAWVGAVMWRGYLQGRRGLLRWLVWLGLLGWLLQEVVEFGLFIPGVSWPAMVLLGWTGARQHSHGQGDKSPVACPNP